MHHLRPPTLRLLFYIMNKPLLVYLDSSDISNLSDPARRTQELIDVEKQLLSWLEQGEVEFRFSHVHVIEAAPTEIQHVELATKRFSYIKYLCGYKCFVSPINILEAEIKRLGDLDTNKDFFVLNDNGEWFPSIEDSEDFFDIQKEYKEEIAALPDRKLRRAAERKYFDKYGNLSSSAKDDIKKSAPEVINEICLKYPLNQLSVDLAYKHFLKTGSMKLLLDEAKNSLADMECIGDWYKRQWNLIIPNSSYLREIGENLKASFKPIRDNFKSLDESMRKLGCTNIQINKVRKESFDDLLVNMPKQLVDRLSSNLGIKLTQDLNWKLTPTLLTLTTLSVSVAKMIVINGQKPRTSDFGDIYHSAYLPYVDIFRADASVSSAIHQAGVPFNTTIVSKLIELPDEISRVLSSRKKTNHSG